MRRWTVIYVLAMLLFVPMSRMAAQPHCMVRTFTIADGLPGNNISDFAQTPDGLMWVATWNGLCCYDGYMFHTFRDMQNSNQVLTSNRLKLIRPSTTGNVWCTTFDGRVYILDRTTCGYTDITKIIKEKTGTEYITHNIHTANGIAWLVGQEQQSVRIDENEILKGGDGITIVTHDKGQKGRGARKMESDSKQREWIFTPNGLMLYGSKSSWNVPYEWMCETDKQIYFAAPCGAFARFDERQQKMIPIALPSEVNELIGLLKRNETTVVLGTNAGVFAYDTKKRRLEKISPVIPYSGNVAIKAMFADSRQRLWVFTCNDGITMIDKVNQPTSISNPPIEWVGMHIDKPFFHEDSNGLVWVIPRSGVFSYYDESSKQLVPYKIDNGGKFPTYSMAAYKTDHQRNLWFTGTHNLTLISFKQHRFTKTIIEQHQDTRSVLICNDGTRLIGMLNGTVASPNPAHSAWNMKLSDKGVYCIYSDRKGRKWFGTKGDGLYMLQGGKMKHFNTDPADKWSLSSPNIYDIKEDAQGRLWIATYGDGLNLVIEDADGNIRFCHAGNTMPKMKEGDYLKVRRLSISKDVMIAATAGGIVTFSTDFSNTDKIKFHYTTSHPGDSLSLNASDVLQVFVSRHTGKIYASTLGGSLEMMKGSNLLADNIPFANVKDLDVRGGTVQSMIEDNKGKLWLIRENTINRYDQTTGECETYGPTDWDESVQFTEAAPSMSSDGRDITIGIIGGTLSFNPLEISKSNYSPRIVFSGIMYQGEQQITPLLSVNELDIPANRRNLTIYFSAIDYQDNRLIRYAYKIKELDSEWSYTGESHSAQLNHLPSGHYTLVVHSTNSDGVWTDNHKEFKIYVEPVFWETWWAWLLYIAIALLAVYAAFCIYRSRQKALMEKRLNVKLMQFFKDISQQLRTPLALIGEPVNQVLADEQLSTTARVGLEFVERNARKMLELVNKGLDMDKLRKTSEEVSTDSNKAFAERAVAYIEEHLDTDLKVSDLTQALGMSRTVLYSKIKTVFGMSPIDFIRHIRMEKAKKLVCETNLPFSEIAYSVGFTDPKYFGKCFKAESGMTLTEYRNKHKNKDVEI